jgi:hypothetical protein
MEQPPRHLVGRPVAADGENQVVTPFGGLPREVAGVAGALRDLQVQLFPRGGGAAESPESALGGDPGPGVQYRADFQESSP